ncbi:MAG TPA: amidohydrolase family protein [Candidatus Binatia bacterium]|jgi:predicted TIM-barrel fold metal-dependent hydrolase
MAYTATGRTKNFPVFDCDSHIYEPPEVWDKFIPENERDFAKTYFYRDADRLISVKNSKISFRNPDKWKYPGETWHPGLNKKIIGSVEPGTKEWDETIGRNRSARDPLVRLKDMDAAGIDQVMVFPSTFVYLPLVENAEAASICARAYNDWVYEYCSADPKRLYPAAILPVQNPDYAIEELRRVAQRGFKAGLVRPIFSGTKYPTLPEYDRLWKEFENLGIVLGMHTFPSRGEAMSPELDQRMGANRKRLFGDEEVLVYSPGQFVANIMQLMGSKQAGDAAFGFIAEAMTWTAVVLMTGWLEKFPRLKVAILESNSSWLPLVLEKAESYLELYKHLGEKIGNPHEVFYKSCFIAFESDEEMTFRLWDLFENIGLWSSDMPHLDAADVWEAIDHMNKWNVPQAVQEKMLGGNARRLYGIEPQLVVTQAPDTYEPVTMSRHA